MRSILFETNAVDSDLSTALNTTTVDWQIHVDQAEVCNSREQYGTYRLTKWFRASNFYTVYTITELTYRLDNRLRVHSLCVLLSVSD